MKRGRRTAEYFAAVLIWIAIWQAAATVANKSLLIPIPTPVSTASALIRLMADRSFFDAVIFSTLRITLGFAAAFIVGTALAVLTWRFHIVKVMSEPLLALIRAVPVASFTILVFLWITRDRIPSVISFITVLPVIWANIESGLTHADGGLIEMAKVFGMPGRGILKEILLPGIRPFFTSSVTSGIGFAWKSGVAAEVICRTRGSLGDLLWVGKSTVDYDEVFAVTIVIVLLSSLMAWGAGRLLRGRTAAAAGREGAKI